MAGGWVGASGDFAGDRALDDCRYGFGSAEVFYFIRWEILDDVRRKFQASMWIGVIYWISGVDTKFNVIHEDATTCSAFIDIVGKSVQWGCGDACCWARLGYEA